MGAFLSLFATTAWSAQVNVLGPNTLRSGVFTKKTYSYNFQTQNTKNAVLAIRNGDGTDVVIKTCNGNFFKKLICRVQNISIMLKAQIERPQYVEFTLNGRVIVTSADLPQTKGFLQIPISLTNSNALRVRLGSLPSQHLSFVIRADVAATNQLPLADFTLTPNSGVAPETIAMNGLLSRDPDGTVIDYFWDFGDGKTGTGPVIAHQYLNAGTYNVKLTVTDNQGGKASKTLPLQLVANQLPLANFTFSNDDLKIHLDASASSDPDGSISGYQFELGDGNTLPGPIVDYNYTAAGSYQVKLTVTDNKGAQSTKIQNIIVTINQPPIARFNFVRGSGNTINFDASSSTDPENAITSYEWNFGDQGTATGVQASHQYAVAGEYTVTLKVTDNKGAQNTIQQKITMYEPLPANLLWSYEECPIDQAGQ